MATADLAYEQLPSEVKDNLSAEQWDEVQRFIIFEGERVPDTTTYINLKNGQIHQHERGEPARGPLLATHNLAGGGGKESAQFESSPPGAHPAPPP
jgi:hypothetical protein